MTDAGLGAYILDRRQRPGLTQAQLAARIGCSTIAVSYWETGHRTPTGLYAKAVRDLMAKHPA
jgi:DNA-binding transcriptional regulator YiaG